MSSEPLPTIEDQLLALGRNIEADSGGISRHAAQVDIPEWRGAKTVVTSDFTFEIQGLCSDLVVRTRHAEQLSWIIFELRDIFTDFLDGQNKYGFYEDLARSALRHLAEHQPESADHRPLLRGVLATGFNYLNVVRQHDAIPPKPRVSISGMDAEGRQHRQYIDPEDNE
jgi:hypothetical protein